MFSQLENLISKNYFLNQSGKDAFKSFIRAYDSHQLKTIFSLAQLDLQLVAKSFGFSQPPAVDLSEFDNILLFIFIQRTFIHRNVAQVQEVRTAARKSWLRLPSQYEQGERRQEDIPACPRSKTAEEPRQQSHLSLNYPNTDFFYCSIL